MKRSNIFTLALTIAFFFGLGFQITFLKNSSTERFALSFTAVFASGDEELEGGQGFPPTCRSSCKIEPGFTCSFPTVDANGDPIIAT